ncbi:MAG TPA: signal peptidase II [Streptosporangiaceae bacterium]
MATGEQAGPEAVPQGAEPSSHGRIWLVLGIAAFVLAADIISKAVVAAHIRLGDVIHLAGNVLELTQVRNGGAAFNIGGTSMTIVFTLIAVGVVTYILRTARNLRSAGWAAALGLLLGGATGNLLDRILRAPGLFRGDVVDWIGVVPRYWPVFNLADSAICCGGVLIAILALRGIRFDGSRVSHADD